MKKANEIHNKENIMTEKCKVLVTHKKETDICSS